MKLNQWLTELRERPLFLPTINANEELDRAVRVIEMLLSELELYGDSDFALAKADEIVGSE